MPPRRRTWSAAPAPDQKPSSLDHPATAGLELFQAANSLGAGTDGYTRWNEEVAAEREATKTARFSLELPAYQDESGYHAWKTAELAARQALEQRWGVPLGKAVRVRLRGELHEREGILRVVPHSGQKPSAGFQTLRLSIGGHEFSVSELEQVTRQ